MEENNLQNKKLIIIGIDGGCWDLLQPLAEKNVLPNIKNLLKKGTWGNLQSTIPPITGPAWASIVTGKKPEKHGIYDFVTHSEANSRIMLSSDIKGYTFYELLSVHNYRSVLIALPLSYPPKKINGIILPDFFSPKIYAYPSWAKKYLTNYRIMPDLSKNNKELVDELIEFENEHMSVAKEIYTNEKWDLFFLHFISTDIISHKYYGEMRKETKIGKEAIRVFVKIDEFIGWFAENLPHNGILFLISDHGFTECTRTFYINNFLKNKTFLKVKPMTEKRIKEVFDFTDNKKEIIIGKHLNSILKINAVRKIAIFFYRKFLSKRYKFRSGYTVDPDRSKFYVPTTSSFCIETNVDASEEYLIKKLQKELTDLKDPLTGKKIFEKVWIIEQLEGKKKIMFLPNEEFFISPLISPRMKDTLFTSERVNFHKRDGIFLAYGKYIKTNMKISDPMIYDITPTILHVFGVPVPNDIDGRVLREIFNQDYQDSKLHKHKVTLQRGDIATLSEKGKIQHTLKRLQDEGKI